MARGRTVHDRTTARQDLPFNAVVATVEVDDPSTIIPEPGKLRDRSRVTVSVRDDPLARLYARRQISNGLYMAGRHWQKLHEHSEVGGLRAIDPSREYVDGGIGFPEMITDRQKHAVMELGRLARVLGLEGDAIIRAFLGSRMPITVIAASRGVVEERGVRYLGMRVKECLDTLARELGYVVRGRS